MRVMVIVKASKESEAAVLPSEKLLAEMGAYNEELAKAGIMLAGEGLLGAWAQIRPKSLIFFAKNYSPLVHPAKNYT